MEIERGDEVQAGNRSEDTGEKEEAGGNDAGQAKKRRGKLRQKMLTKLTPSR